MVTCKDVQMVDKFKFLGSVITINSSSIMDINIRLVIESKPHCK